MVARVPYPVTEPKFYAVASEVATMEFLRTSKIPVPEVYGYAPASDNAAETPYIFMEYIRGTNLGSVWSELEEKDILHLMGQLAILESRMMSMSFPAGGSLYYTRDLEQLAGDVVVPLEDKQFCVGPDTRPRMWSGRRSQLDVDRGPCTSLLPSPTLRSLSCLHRQER
jgi:hypothetical protein